MEGRGRHRRLSPFVQPRSLPSAPRSVNVTTPTGVCTIAGSTITFVSAGTCSITASQAGDATYVAATSVTRSFNITKLANTITFPALPNTPITSPPPTPARSLSEFTPFAPRGQELGQADDVVGGHGEDESGADFARPRTLNCVRPPTVFIQPKLSSMRLRSRWLTA